MIAAGSDLKIYIATRPIDFRCGHDGLAVKVQEMLRLAGQRAHLLVDANAALRLALGRAASGRRGRCFRHDDCGCEEKP